LKPAVVEQALRPRDPATTSSQLTTVQQGEREPERAARRPRDLAYPCALLVRAGPHFGTLLAAPEVVGRRREPLEILVLERLVPCGIREVLVRASPRLAVECGSA